MYNTRIVLLLLLAAAAALEIDWDEDSPEFIAAINAKAKTWTAGENDLPNPLYVLPVRDGRRRSTLPWLEVDDLLRNDNATDNLPETFDGRLHWSECPSLNQIRNQGCCGACYAVAAAAAITDRWCIHSEGREQFYFSAIDAVSCCDACGDCTRGFQDNVWIHWRDNGIVSGGEFNSSQGCKPFPIDTCADGQDPEQAPACERQCREGYQVQYADDKRYASAAYHVPADERFIMWAIYHHGPVAADFDIYTDFFRYRRGVYEQVLGRLRGGHTLKLIGWGVEGGTKYWLAANSWGPNFGQRGYMKFLRGENHLGIEGSVYGGIPRYD